MIRRPPIRLLLIAAAIALLATGCVPAQATATPISAATSVVYGPDKPTPTAQAASQPASTVRPTLEVRPTLLPSATPEPASARPVPPQKGALAYDFELEDLAGNVVRLSDLRGKKVMLNFWATWCGPCRIEIPHMVENYDRLEGGDFEIVAVNLREDPDKVASFVESFGMRFPVLLDSDAKVGSAYYVRSIPTSLFLDAEGRINDIHIGTLTEDALLQYLEALDVS